MISQPPGLGTNGGRFGGTVGLHITAVEVESAAGDDLAMCIVVSSGASCMPSQKEPHTSQGISLSSMTKFGSMAFQLSVVTRHLPVGTLLPVVRAEMQPSSFHISDRSERVLSRPMAEPFLPKVEQL